MPRAHPKEPRAFRLTLRPEPGADFHPDPHQRLRGALKCLLRQFGLRCTDMATIESAVRTDAERRGVCDRCLSCGRTFISPPLHGECVDCRH